jgi:hypothetical protein
MDGKTTDTPSFRAAGFYSLLIIYMRGMYKIPRAGTLGIIGSQMSYIPGPIGLFFRCSRLLSRPEINQIIRPIMKIFADNEGSLPRR